jgi:archaeal cell division control protein 6
MVKRLLTSDQTLFRDREVFEIDHMPEQFFYRESQLRELAFAVRPGLHGARPLNAVCKGLPGTGKTTSVLRIFAEVEETTKKLVPVYVNCQDDRTKYMVFSRIYAKIFGHAPPRTGISIRTVMDAIGGALQRQGVVLLVCLDDANLLHYDGTLNGVLNSLLRLHQDYPGVRTGVFATVSDMDVDLSRDLEAWVVSAFRPAEIPFPPYDAGEIRGILRERIRVGLYPGVVSAEILNLVVDRTMESGDVRVGLDMVKRAVLNAECAASTEVSRTDVTAAYEHAKHVHLACTIRALSAAERRLLKRIAELSEARAGLLTSGAVYAEVKGRPAQSYTSIYTHLRKLDALRLIDLIRVHGDGRTSEIALRYEPRRVAEVCG